MTKYAGLNYINLKLSRSVYILNSVKRMLPMPYLKTLYYTMIQPYLNYGITLWGATYQSYLKRTVILQKRPSDALIKHSIMHLPIHYSKIVHY